MSESKPSAQREECPSRDALVARGILPRAEFQVCGDCGMPSSCRSARHCCRAGATHGIQAANPGMLSNGNDWPFHRLAAERRAVFDKVDADVTTWMAEVQFMLDKVGTDGFWRDALKVFLDRVVAVRA